jgi:hypothetical protein
MENCNRIKPTSFSKVCRIKWEKVISFSIIMIMVSMPIFAQTSALNALRIDGVDDFAYPLTPNAAGLAQGTVEMWFSTENWVFSRQIWGGGNGIPGVQGDWTRLGTHFSVGADQLAFGKYAGGWQWAASSTKPVDGKWYHVAATWEFAGLKIYINGKLAGQNSYSGAMHNYAFELVGASSWGFEFSGAIDEMRIWNFPLDSTAIAKNLDKTLGVEYYSTLDSGLIAYYQMDVLEDLGINSDGADDLRDLSVNGNHLDTEGNPTLEPSGAFVFLTGIDDGLGGVPGEYSLEANYPNPFNPSTVISWQLGVSSPVKLTVYDIRGQKIATLVNEIQPAGNHSVNFDAHNLAGGLYFYQLSTGDFTQTRKMLLVK